MPRDLTHIILADDIGEKLPVETAKNLSLNKTAYHMGAISHDSFLYGPSPKLSTKMHGGLGDDTRKIVLTLLDGVRRETDPEMRNIQKAFTFGFLSHMATDTAFHPFVYSVSGSQVRENNPSDEHVRLAKARHRYTETWLDMHFVEKKGYNFDNFRPMRKIVCDVKNRKKLSGFFCEAYQRAYDVDDNVSKGYEKGMLLQLFLGKMTWNQSLARMMRRLDMLMGDRLATETSGFYQKDRKIPEQLTQFSSYTHPVTGEKVHKTLDDLTKDAVERGVALISAAEKYISNGNRKEFLHAVPNTNLDTGIPDTRLSDIKRAVPVPLSSLKGTKRDAFGRRGGLKVMPSGADVEGTSSAKTAHPVLLKYFKRFEKTAEAALTAFKQKTGLGR